MDNEFAGMILLFIAFIPTIIAFISTSKRTLAIIALSVLLGFTVICWIIGLVMACEDFYIKYIKEGEENGNK